MFWKKIDLKVEQIYNDYGKLIFSIAYQRLKDFQLAEDATQETILKIIKNSSKINELETNELKNYVARIAANASNDFYNKRKKENIISDEEIKQIEEINATDIESYIITKDSVKKIKAEIQNLDEKYRDPLTLHKLNKHTIKEVSELLNVPERTVKYRIHRALQLLKVVLVKGDGKDE